MSAKTSRPRVESVSSATLSTVAIGGITLVATLITALCRAGRSVVRATQSTASKNRSSDSLKSVQALRQEHMSHRQEIIKAIADENLAPLEEAKLSALASLAATPYMAQDNATLREALAKIENAGTVAEARRAEAQLVSTLEAGHQQLFVQALTMACASASMKCGFNSIETTPGIGNMVRVVAMDPKGRALVTEISGDPEAGPSIETEVFGVTDSSCNRILDAFDQALEEAAVRAAAPPVRKFTGGVCELAATREVASKLMRRRSVDHEEAAAGNRDANQAARRGQRLNSRSAQKQR
jgi:hypothetical protein